MDEQQWTTWTSCNGQKKMDSVKALNQPAKLCNVVQCSLSISSSAARPCRPFPLCKKENLQQSSIPSNMKIKDNNAPGLDLK
ncbi:MAG: hypothetical protein WCF65_02640 [Parachlamydiaceae bacterium]